MKKLHDIAPEMRVLAERQAMFWQSFGRGLAIATEMYQGPSPYVVYNAEGGLTDAWHNVAVRMHQTFDKECR